MNAFSHVRSSYKFISIHDLSSWRSRSDHSVHPEAEFRIFPIVPAMNGSPVSIPSSFLQPMEPADHSLEPQGERGVVGFTSSKTPTTYDKEAELSSSVFFPGLESGRSISFNLLGIGALHKGASMVKKRKSVNKDELSEDYCFVCKDGGEIRVCDFKGCLKSYHPLCLKKDHSFLESDERWTCGWHSCYNCQKSSTFKCFCCPYSSCRACIGGSELVQVKGTKGFCISCLRLAKLIEENVDVNSDGEVVDFDDTDTYEFLFKDYWEIVKEKEGLTLVNLQAANDLLKKGGKLKNMSDSDENFEDQVEPSDDDCGDEAFPPKNFIRKQGGIKMVKEKFKSKKMTYVGWASKELSEFLISLGRDTRLPLGQHDVFEIVKEYIQSNNFLRHDKKKKQHVLCDARLLSLFRRKKVSFFKIYSLLEKHLAENNDSDNESFILEKDDDYDANSAKKQRMYNSPSKQRMEREQPPKKCYAAINEANINLIYLKRSLILELMKDPKTFEKKVVGCFVRRQCEPKDFYWKNSYGHHPPKIYQLNQIIGVKKLSEKYKLGDVNTDIVLCVSNYWRDVQISMLSDDNIEEEECEELRQLVKQDLLKRPAVDELKEKIKTIHEDMVNHAVKKELLKLEKQIARANEKGWRKELFDCIERRKLLNKPQEIMRLMKVLPDVAIDMEVEAAEGHEGCFSKRNASTVVIEIDDEEADDHMGPSNPVSRSEEKIWNYKDPSGNVQGPFSLSALRFWKEQGFFDEDFTIWRTQTHEAAIPLTLALIPN